MLVIVLALVSAALSALSAAGEQRVAAQRRGAIARRSAVLPSRRRFTEAGLFAAALLTSPLWLGSWAVDATSFFTQAAALRLGSLSVVQPLMVTMLLFTLPLAALGTRRRLQARDWAGAFLICAGLAVVLSTRDGAGPAGDDLPAGDAGPLSAMGVVLFVVVVVVAAGLRRGPRLRTVALSVGAGALFALGAATTKLAAGVFTDAGFVGLLTSWPGYALAALSVASFVTQQVAYAGGPLATAVTAAVITDPLVSYFLGVVGFGEPAPHGVGLTLLAILGLGVLAIGIAILARSPLLQAAPSTDATPQASIDAGEDTSVPAGVVAVPREPTAEASPEHRVACR